MVLATIFVSLPLVVREVAPVLEEIGIEQEQAAWTLGATGCRPSAGSRCRPSAGRSPTAWCSPWPASLGEFGAVAVVSGRLVGKTQTADAVRRGAVPELRPAGAPTPSSFALALVAIVILVVINVLRPKEHS